MFYSNEAVEDDHYVERLQSLIAIGSGEYRL